MWSIQLFPVSKLERWRSQKQLFKRQSVSIWIMLTCLSWWTALKHENFNCKTAVLHLTRKLSTIQHLACEVVTTCPSCECHSVSTADWKTVKDNTSTGPCHFLLDFPQVFPPVWISNMCLTSESGSPPWPPNAFPSAHEPGCWCDVLCEPAETWPDPGTNSEEAYRRNKGGRILREQGSQSLQFWLLNLRLDLYM